VRRVKQLSPKAIDHVRVISTTVILFMIGSRFSKMFAGVNGTQPIPLRISTTKMNVSDAEKKSCA
jgi:hypothetical protein